MLHVDQRQQWVQLCRDKRVVVVDQEIGASNRADINTKSFQRHPGKFMKQRAWIQFSVPANIFSTGDDPQWGGCASYEAACLDSNFRSG